MDRILAERIPRRVAHAERELSELLAELSGGLKVDSLQASVGRDGWVRVAFVGEDQEAYETILQHEFGFAKPSLYEIPPGETLKGFVSERDSTGESLRLDVGVVEPSKELASARLSALRAQLCDGEEVGMKPIMEVFCLRDDVPLELRVTTVSGQSIECWLSDRTMERLEEWRSLPLERLVIVGATRKQVTRTIDHARLSRDVARLDSLSAFVQVVSAKIGTRARGLIRPLGSRLAGAHIHVFDPRNARNLMVEARGH